MPIVSSLGEVAGQPVIDHARCTACGLCVEICPTLTLKLARGKVEVDPATAFGCIACGQCTAICPPEAITVSERGLRPDDRLPLAPIELRATAEQLAGLLTARRSIRHFEDREVDAGTIQRIIELAATAPMGIPPWEVGIVVLRGRAKVQAFVKDFMASVNRGLKMLGHPLALKAMRPFIGQSAYDAFRSFIVPLFQTLSRQHNLGHDKLFYDAPAVLLFHVSSFGDNADVHIAATYAMLAAESLGLGSCLIGTVPPMLDRDKALKEKYGIPKGNKCGLALILGYPRHRFARGVRRRFASVKYV